jgi:hypothetical protein
MGLTSGEIFQLICYLRSAIDLSGYCMLIPVAFADLSSLEANGWNRMHDEDLMKTLVAIKSDLYISTGHIELNQEETSLHQITLRLTSLSVSCAGVAAFLATQKRIIDFIKIYLVQERGDMDSTQPSRFKGLGLLEERILFLDETLKSEQQLSRYNSEAIQAQIQTVFPL